MRKRQSKNDDRTADPETGDQSSAPVPDVVADAVQPERHLETESEVDILRDELERLQAEVAEHKERYLRAVAEVENTRRRAQNDVANARKFAVENFAAEALSVRDSLELASAIEVREGDSEVVAKIKEGLDLTLKQLDAVFGKFAITPIEPDREDKLDPERHQAMSAQESAEIAPNHIVAVIQKGYAIHDRLLRPAMVIVAKEIAEKQADSEVQEG